MTAGEDYLVNNWFLKVNRSFLEASERIKPTLPRREANPSGTYQPPVTECNSFPLGVISRKMKEKMTRMNVIPNSFSLSPIQSQLILLIIVKEIS